MLNLNRTTALLIFACILAGAKGYSQSITLSRNNVPLTRIFKDIEKQTEYVFFFDRSLLRDAKKVTIEVKGASLKEALDQCFSSQPLEYVISGKTITIKRLALPITTGPPLTSLLTVKGHITTADNEPVPGVTVTIKNADRQIATNDQGEFILENVDPAATLIISSINYEKQEIKLEGRTAVNISLQKRVSELSAATVVSTGYQDLRKENTTGAFSKIGNALFNRRVSTNVIDRLEGITNSLLFNKNIFPEVNQSALSIRGRSTIFANPEPLIILDNFPYTGNISNINPNDIDNITILKDAAAASIWGAYAGNGVIVITTKKGRLNQAPKVSFNANVSVAQKPDIFYPPAMSSSDYIDMEQFLFSQSYYTSLEAIQSGRVLTPAVEIMIKKRDGLLSGPEADAQLNALRKLDKRNDLEKYFYRNSTTQQYAINVNGGGPNNNYYFSAGFDRSLPSLRGDSYSRFTLNGNNTYTLLDKNLELNTGIIFSSTKSSAANTAFQNITYPYAQFADANGNALVIPADLRQPYKDTIGRGSLLDWNYRPRDEINLADNNTRVTDYRVNVNLKYKIFAGLFANVFYQYNNGYSEQENFQSLQSYFTRNIINRFTQLGGTPARPVPLGGIMDANNIDYEAHNLRGQINFNHTWQGQHALTAISGAELRTLDVNTSANRLYGYNKDQQTSMVVDYLNDYPLIYSGAPEKIPYRTLNEGNFDRYISYYLNAIYTWKERYILSASVRKDESNIFGVKTNQKGVPLWSIGGSWILDKEPFYSAPWLPLLKLRATNGYTGNVDRTVSAYTSASIRGLNSYNAIPGLIINPPNPSLRWEKIHMFNVGVDFEVKDEIITGSIDYYIRNSKDLIGVSPLDPTTGNNSFRGNTASMKGNGIDIILNTTNLRKKFKWNTYVLFSYTTDKVTDYKIKQPTIGSYLSQGFLNPLPGNPLYSVYSLRWQGLDQTGDPVGYLDGHVSKNYGMILSSTNFDNIVYKGPANPVVFGSIRNTFSFKQVELSFLITYKTGYYFRRPSINYLQVYNGASPGHPDFSLRWMKPGDENTTNVPAMKYPEAPQRSNFYNYAEILVEKGDHVRLQDIQLSYTMQKQRLKKLPVALIKIYAYANNIGILWRANHKDIDPDFVSGIPNPRTISAGVKIDF